MSEILTMAEMKARYDREWVLIDEPETGPGLEVLSGAVLFHGKDRAEFDRRLLELRPRNFAIRYLGPIAENTVLIL